MYISGSCSVLPGLDGIRWHKSLKRSGSWHSPHKYLTCWDIARQCSSVGMTLVPLPHCTANLPARQKGLEKGVPLNFSFILYDYLQWGPGTLKMDQILLAYVHG